MRTFVTGGTGFIGSSVVDLLVGSGHAVSVFSRRRDLPPRWQGRNVTIVPGDLRDPEQVLDAMEGAEIVFHIGELRNTTAADSEKNLELVRKMTGELKHSGVKRFVFVSSLTVAGVPAAVPATEETKPAFALRDQYTEYKRKAEDLIRQSQNGVEHAIVRPGIVYGPGSRYLGRMVRTVAQFGPIGIPFIGPGRNRAPFIQVQDLALAIYLAGTRPEGANQTFNVTDTAAHTWREFFAAVGRAQGREVRLVPLPPFLIRFPAVFADLFAGLFGFHLDLHSYVTFLSRNIEFDPRKARTLLGWDPEHGDLDAAVGEMVCSYGKKEK
jgi:nucleoside-diphosphate-sugar epimerase